MKKISVLIGMLFLAATVNAKPIIISFEEMMDQSKSIVIGTYLGEYVTGKIFHIEVDSVVKGEKRSGIMTVNKAKGIPRLLPGTKVMAFINEQDQWEWCGVSGDFRHGIIYLSGFYDYNSYEVYPDAVSLVQLDEFKRTGTYHGAIEGSLRFWSFQKHAYENTSTYFVVMYTYFGKDSTSTRYMAGGLNTGKFNPVPQVVYTGSSVVLTYDENNYRPLEIYGSLDSVKSNGSDFAAHFEVAEPSNLSKEQYTQYIANEQYGLLCYDLAVLVNSRPGEAVVGVNMFPFVYGEEEGDIGYIVFGGRQISCTQFAIPTDDQSGTLKFGTWSQTEIEIELDPVSPAVDYDSIRMLHGDRLINILKFTAITGQMYVYEHGVRVSRGTCSIIMQRSRFTPNLSWNDN